MEVIGKITIASMCLSWACFPTGPALKLHVIEREGETGFLLWNFHRYILAISELVMPTFTLFLQ